MMKLSEAIRLGAMLRPQAMGEIKTKPGRGHKAATCALGAAWEAAGVKTMKLKPGMPTVGMRGLSSGTTRVFQISNEWFALLSERHPCPRPNCDYPRFTLSRIIPHLNDYHRWTRERIADWVATIEPKEPEPRVEAELSPADMLAVKEGK